MKPRAADLLFAALLLAVVAAGLVGLDAVPRMHTDEPWQAAPGYELVTRGRFASQLFSGFHGMERHYYGFMPLSPILLGVSLRLFGLGLFQMRLVPLALASLVLLLTYLLGKRLFSPGRALLAALVLASWPVAAPMAQLSTGIPLADLARVARYDIAVPVFGLLALLAVARASGEAPPPGSFALAGVLAGLAALSHVYGAFWLPALLLPFVARTKDFFRRALAALGGFCATLAPWLLFVCTGFPDFLDQNRNYAERFALGHPAFFAHNLAHEIERYGFVARGAREGALASWLFVAALVAGTAVLLRAREGATRLLLGPAAVLVGLFALLLEQKNRMYLASLWPFLALVAAVALGALLADRRPWVRIAAALLVAAATLEGARRYADLFRRAREATDYASLAARVAAAVPRGARLLAPSDYWTILDGRVAAYRALQVPIFLSQARYTPHPIPFAEAADRGAPDTLLLDESILHFLEEARAPAHPFAPLARAIEGYAGQGARIAAWEDPTYGRFAVYRLAAR